MAHHRRPSTINLDPAFTRQSTQVIGGTHSIFSSGSDSDGSTFELPDTGDYIPSSSGSSSDDEKFVDSNMVNSAPGSSTDSSPSKRPTRQRVVAVIKKSGAIQYTYDNQLLPAVESRHSEMPGYDDTDDDKKLELTSWCIDHLYRSTHNDVREIIESATVCPAIPILVCVVLTCTGYPIVDRVKADPAQGESGVAGIRLAPPAECECDRGYAYVRAEEPG